MTLLFLNNAILFCEQYKSNSWNRLYGFLGENNYINKRRFRFRVILNYLFVNILYFTSLYLLFDLNELLIMCSLF